MYNDNNKQTFR